MTTTKTTATIHQYQDLGSAATYAVAAARLAAAKAATPSRLRDQLRGRVEWNPTTREYDWYWV